MIEELIASNIIHLFTEVLTYDEEFGTILLLVLNAMETIF